MENNIKEEEVFEILEKIAQENDLDTLKVRKMDDLDFYDMSVWTIEELMKKSFEAGLNYKEDK